MNVMRRILGGMKPSAVFREMLIERPDLNNGDLAEAFHNEFPAAGLDAIQVIWKWRRPGRSTGLDDAGVDQRLFYVLRQKGYFDE